VIAELLRVRVPVPDRVVLPVSWRFALSWKLAPAPSERRATVFWFVGQRVCILQQHLTRNRRSALFSG
jgi:hypothetical protein